MAWFRCCFYGEEEESRQSNEMTKATKSTTLMPYIPHHLLVQILLKLPVKSLIRFKCVSKLWLSLISDSRFTRNHLNQSINHKGILILNSHPGSHHVYTADLGTAHKDIVAEKIDNILDMETVLLEIIGSCNGLVCMKFLLRVSYVIFNLSTRESKQIPYCDLRPYEAYNRYRYGFGYDSCSNDYKLVQLGRCSVYVYSLRAGSWKKVQDYVKNSFYVEDMSSYPSLWWLTNSQKFPCLVSSPMFIICAQ
ncbi:F-box/kelch-repeat protein At3g06240-like [Cornus florida]|uniref:F-box/kelch-repeat protein At3g06240-like n=1 Tax=Cornus florida TaxID=4283 RepID=UPI00289A01B9|nr:F-box/kelch-repeat protein At3g06240-like [Cornus florida]